MVRMDSLDWKKALSIVREGDYAHAGEIDAIELCFENINKESNRKLLDVGCGLGGTANYIQENGWGNVVGIDIQGEIIESAKERYQSLSFYTCDVLKVTDVIKDTFDIIYMFNAFYAFSNQERALQEIAKLANTNSTLIIFDYVDNRIKREGEIFRSCKNPIILSEIENLLERSGWKSTKIVNLTTEYEQWYKQFLDRIKNKSHEIINIIGEDGYNLFLSSYENILELIQNEELSGCVLFAKVGT